MAFILPEYFLPARRRCGLRADSRAGTDERNSRNGEARGWLIWISLLFAICATRQRSGKLCEALGITRPRDNGKDMLLLHQISGDERRLPRGRNCGHAAHRDYTIVEMLFVM